MYAPHLLGSLQIDETSIIYITNNGQTCMESNSKRAGGVEMVLPKGLFKLLNVGSQVE